MADVSFKVIADTQEAVSRLAKFSESSSRHLGGIESSFKSLGSAAKLLGGLFVADKIVDGLKAIVGASSEAEDAANGMRNAMKLAGDFSQRNAQQFEGLAREIQRTTKYDDDLVISQVKVAKQYGATNAEAEKLIRASVDLAARTGKTLPEAVELLGKTLDGTAGKLAEAVPELRNFTAEQLASGAAIELVAKKFKGAAEGDIDVYSGAVAQAGNAFSNFLEILGDAVTKNASVIASIKAFKGLFEEMSVFVEQNKSQIADLVTGGILVLAKSFAFVAQAVKLVQETFEILYRDTANWIRQLGALPSIIKNIATLDFEANKKIKAGLESAYAKDDAAGAKRLKVYDDLTVMAGNFGAAIEKARSSQDKTSVSVEKAAAGFDDMVPKVQRVNAEIAKGAQDLVKKLQGEGATAFESLAKRFADDVTKLQRGLEQGSISRVQFLQAESQLRAKVENDIHNLRMKLHEQEQREFEKDLKENAERLRGIVSNPLASLIPKGTNRLGLTQDTQTGVAAGVGGLTSALNGRQGAQALISNTAELAGQAFLGVPGMGALVSQLSQGPDQVKKMINEFADAVPDIVAAIVEAIPVVIETLADRLPDMIERIIDRLASRADKIAEGLIRAMPKVALALATALPKVLLNAISGALTQGLLQGAASFVGKILEGAVNFVGSIINGAGKFVEELVKKIPVIGGGGGGGGGIIPDSVPVVGFLKGGGSPAISSKGGGLASQVTSSLGGGIGGQQPILVQLVLEKKVVQQIMIDFDRRGVRTTA